MRAFMIPIPKQRLRAAAAIVTLAFAAAFACSADGQPDYISFEGIQSTVISTGLPGVSALAVDSLGNLYVVIAQTGQVFKETLLNGVYTQSVVASGFQLPAGIAVDSAGDVFIADATANTVYKETPVDGSYVQSVVDVFGTPVQIAIDPQGDLFITNVLGGEVIEEKWSGSNYQKVVIAHGFNRTTGVAVSETGDGASTSVYFADYYNGVYEVDLGLNAGGPFLISSTPNSITGMAVDPFRGLYAVTYPGNYVYRWNPAFFGLSTLPSRFNSTQGIAVDTQGDLFVGDSVANAIGEIQFRDANFGATAVGSQSSNIKLSFIDQEAETSQGPSINDVLTTSGVPGFDYLGGFNGFCEPEGAQVFECSADVAFSPRYPGISRGDLLMVDESYGYIDYSPFLQNQVALSGMGMGPQIAFSGSTSTMVANALIAPTSLTTNADGVSYVLANSKEALETLPDGTQIDNNFGSQQAAIALDNAGNLLGISANPSPVGLSVMFGPQSSRAGPVEICDTPLDLVSAFAYDPYDGNYYAASGTGSSYPGLIKFGVTSDLLNHIFCSWTPLPASLVSPTQIAFDAQGNVYVADGSKGVVKLNLLGVQSVVAAGSGATGVAVDAAGDLYYSDTTGKVYDLPAGGESVLIDAPSGVTNVSLDGAGNLYTINYISPTVGTVVRINRATAPTLTFAQTKTGAVSVDSPKTTSIQNTGNTPLKITSIVYPPDFPEAVGSPNLCAASTSLAPGQMCNVTFNFAPKSAGVLSEMITITDNNLNVAGAQQQIGVSGTGLMAQTISFTPPTTVVYGVAAIDLSKDAQATSGMPVAFKVVSGPATVLGTILSVSGAGSIVVQASQGGGGSYGAATPVNKTITVTPALLYVTAYGQSKVYGAALPALTYAYAGFVNGDTAAKATSGVPTLSTTATVSSAVGTYPINVGSGTLTAANYSLKLKPGILTITQALLYVTADSPSKVYGAAMPSFYVIFAGFLNGDTAAKATTGEPGFSTVAKASSPVGSCPVTPTAGTLTAANYTFKFKAGSLAVTPAPLYVTAYNQTIAHGAPLPKFTYAFAGFVNGDTAAVATGAPVLSTTATSASPAGTYPITVAAGTLTAANYMLKLKPGTLTITPGS